MAFDFLNSLTIDTDLGQNEENANDSDIESDIDIDHEAVADLDIDDFEDLGLDQTQNELEPAANTNDVQWSDTLSE